MHQRAMVVFLGKELVELSAWYARWLKPGFAHCFMLIESDGNWIKLEGRKGTIGIKFLGKFTEKEQADHYRDQGALVVEAIINDEAIKFPLVERTCVGLIKSVLGIASPLLSPWQLYKHLTR
jgi:hypothetical protein